MIVTPSEDKSVYNKWCICSDTVICPSGLWVVRCKIDRPLNSVEAYIETECGDWECCSLADVYDTKAEAYKALHKLINELYKNMAKEMSMEDIDE